MGQKEKRPEAYLLAKKEGGGSFSVPPFERLPGRKEIPRGEKPIARQSREKEEGGEAFQRIGGGQKKKKGRECVLPSTSDLDKFTVKKKNESTGLSSLVERGKRRVKSCRMATEGKGDFVQFQFPLTRGEVLEGYSLEKRETECPP